MIELTQRLIDSEHAYPAAGDVYFAVGSFTDYGSLSRQDPAATLRANDTLRDDRKREPADFALWKRPKPGEPPTASWPTPWGRARPGWHLQCSAMSTRYLGSAFDIHGGGRDLIFPHHENELAQSRAAGDAFARYWMHHGLVTVGDEKISTSQANPVLVADLTTRWRPVEVRYYLGFAHYRSTLEFSPGALAEAAVAYRRIEQFTKRARETLGDEATGVTPEGSLPDAFASAMDQDLGVPAALGVIQSTVRRGNVAVDLGDRSMLREALNNALSMTHVLASVPTSG